MDEDNSWEWSGISVTHTSDNRCKKDAEGNFEYYTFTANILCDPEIAESGGAQVIGHVDTECGVTATVRHQAGCHIYTAPWWVRINAKYPWVLATIMLILGPIIGLFGLYSFSMVSSIVGGSLAFTIVVLQA